MTLNICYRHMLTDDNLLPSSCQHIRWYHTIVFHSNVLCECFWQILLTYGDQGTWGGWGDGGEVWVMRVRERQRVQRELCGLRELHRSGKEASYVLWPLRVEENYENTLTCIKHVGLWMKRLIKIALFDGSVEIWSIYWTKSQKNTKN